MFKLFAHFVCQGNLGGAEVSRLRVLALLPYELLGKAVSKPDVEVCHVLTVCGIRKTRLQKLNTLVIPFLEGDTVPGALHGQNTIDHVSDFATWHALEAITVVVLLLRRGAHDNVLVDASDIMPTLLVFLGKDPADRGNRLINILLPFHHDGRRSYARILFLLLKSGLASLTVGPSHRELRHDGIWRCDPLANFLAAHTPMQDEVIIRVSIPGHQINRKKVRRNRPTVCEVNHLLLTLIKILVQIGEFPLGFLRTWEVPIRHFSTLGVKCFMPDKYVERNTISHHMLIVFEIGVFFEVNESIVEVYRPRSGIVHIKYPSRVNF